MVENAVQEVEDIIKFTLRGSFDSLEVIRSVSIEPGTEESKFIIKGTRGEDSYTFQIRYSTAFAAHKDGSLNHYLLYRRDRIFREIHDLT